MPRSACFLTSQGNRLVVGREHGARLDAPERICSEAPRLVVAKSLWCPAVVLREAVVWEVGGRERMLVRRLCVPALARASALRHVHRTTVV